LQINLVLHERLPETHSPRVVYAPRATNSELHDMVGSDGESIGLYFYNAPATDGALLPTDLTVALPTWPARSADQAVAEFARYLHRSIAAEQNKALHGSPDKHALRNIDWTGVRNLGIFLGIVVTATWMIAQIPAETKSLEAETRTLPNAVAPPLIDDPSATPDLAAGSRPDAGLPDQSAAVMRMNAAVSVAPLRVKSCGRSSNEILTAVLTLQAPTDFTRCSSQHKTEQHLADTH
jgi:hypothetical protein